ncbi:MAG: AAA family ATPase [Candidatus Anstonellales archaeon]
MSRMKVINRAVLSPQYLPSNLPYREKEIEIISKYLERFDQGEQMPNIIIYGPTGSGKTSVIKYIIRHRSFKNIDVVYLNARLYNTSYKILSKVTDDEEKLGYPISYFIARLKNRSKNLVLVIDEADFVRDIDDLLYTLSRIDDGFNISIAMILITNSIQLKSKLDPRTLSSLNDIELFFKPYSAEQLKDILKTRVEMAIDGEYDIGAIAKIAALATAESGDARYALKLLSRALEICETENANKLTIDHVDRAVDMIEFDVVAEAIRAMPMNIQIVLYSIAKSLSGKQKDLFESTLQDMLSISELYNNYIKISESVFGRKAKSLKWFKHYLSELENLGFVSLIAVKTKSREVVSYVRLGMNHKDILKYFEKYIGIK